ncbi:8368_t:CDS:1 [Scutellospora calospora]|uniref:8368_t:CDS:1 n=1 Tax=Scutellospora calospora TaxID=85575 RepID=A0ACA9JZH9_9GLOM|nr:8368_t:CDS:1 [Scutellospora calospora]
MANSSDRNKIYLPFPPSFNIDDFIKLKENGEKPKKLPNAFLIYRTLFQKEIQKHGLKLHMITLSKMIGVYWGKESKLIKDEYERISKEIEKKFYEKWPIPYKIQYKNEIKFKEKNNINDDNINNDNQNINFHDNRTNFFSNPNNNINMINYHKQMINNHQYMINFHINELRKYDH